MPRKIREDVMISAYVSEVEWKRNRGQFKKTCLIIRSVTDALHDVSSLLNEKGLSPTEMGRIRITVTKEPARGWTGNWKNRASHLKHKPILLIDLYIAVGNQYPPRDGFYYRKETHNADKD